MNLNDDIVDRRLRLGPLHQLHPRRSSSLVRHHDRPHHPPPISSSRRGLTHAGRTLPGEMEHLWCPAGATGGNWWPPRRVGYEGPASAVGAKWAPRSAAVGAILTASR